MRGLTLFLGASVLASFAAVAAADDSCVWANDGECDEASLGGTGVCRDGTDTTDCRGLVRGPDSCVWARDGECDEPRYGGTGACGDGTDTTDCRGLALAPPGPDSCRWANDGECDEPQYGGTGYCNDGTDTADCRGGGGTAPAASGPDSCVWANDGECDEPRFGGTGACADGTDTTDCTAAPGGAAAVPGGAPATWSAFTSITPDQRQFATQPGGVMPLMVNGDMRFHAGDYMIYHGISDPDGLTISEWRSYGPVTLAGGNRYVLATGGGMSVSLVPGGGSLIMYPEPGAGQAMIYARNDDVAHWRAVCVLPVGWAPETDCFRPYTTIRFVPPTGQPAAGTGKPADTGTPAIGTPQRGSVESPVCRAVLAAHPGLCVIPPGDGEDPAMEAVRQQCCR